MNSINYNKIVNSSDKNERADVLLANSYTKYSRAALVKLFDMGHVLNNKIPAKPGDKIKPGSYIEADLTAIEAPAADIDMPIIYEDDSVIVVNKPSGVISHARGRYWDEPSVASFIRQKTSGFDDERAGIVHRLDRATSGVMICAKNKAALSYLQRQFSNRTVSKKYIAVVRGSLSPTEGIIDVPLGRNPNNPKTFIPDANGKNAVTEYHTEFSGKSKSIIKLHPKTGRTHQLRVHLKYLNHPIIGDELYGGESAERLMLHAESLEITIPGGERKVFSATVPSDFKV